MFEDFSIRHTGIDSAGFEILKESLAGYCVGADFNVVDGLYEGRAEGYSYGFPGFAGISYEDNVSVWVNPDSAEAKFHFLPKDAGDDGYTNPAMEDFRGLCILGIAGVCVEKVWEESAHLLFISSLSIFFQSYPHLKSTPM